MQTSATAPLRVDFLPSWVLNTPGRIGLTICPGKKDSRAGWNRDLETDLARLESTYRTSRLVSLMESHEYTLLEVPGLLEEAKKRFEVRWFPVPDVSTPKDSEMPAYRHLVADALEACAGGETVVLHCRGGLGRSGTLAACCLVAHGIEPARAIDFTRLARPGAVETPSQVQWVHRFG